MIPRTFAISVSSWATAVFERRPPGVGIRGPAGGGQRQAQGAEALQRLVVQLPSPAAALVLGSGLAGHQPLGADRACGDHRARRARGERRQQPLVLVTEVGSTRRMERDQHAGRLGPEHERDEEPGAAPRGPGGPGPSR